MTDVPSEYDLGTMEPGEEPMHEVVAAYDRDGDGKIDLIAYDQDGDGKADKIIVDTDGDGTLDTERHSAE
jgi:hypothetical protein